MPQIAPFRAVRYAKAQSLQACIAPPYDVISPAQRALYAARDPHNVVHLILPEGSEGEAEGETKYERAGRLYREWQAEGVLTRDSSPAIYVLHQAFEWEGKPHLRRGLLARLRLRPFSDGVVLPHERTLSGPKADRLQLFRSVKANLSPIFALYPEDHGESGAIAKHLESVLSTEPSLQARGDDGVRNEAWRVEDPAVLAAIVSGLSARKAFIADGHHRYETGLAYAAELDAQTPRPDGAHHSILAYLCGMGDPGLLILPTHRLLHSLQGFDLEKLVQRAEEFFDVEAMSLADEGEVGAVRQRLAALGKHRPAVALVAGGRAFLLGLRESDFSHAPEMPRQKELASLDVTVLHSLILQRLLGLSVASQERQENLRYVKDAAEAVTAVRRGEAQAAFLMNPTVMEQVRSVAEAGMVMPQKSTFFFPKLPSGLLFNPLDPEERLV